MAIKSGLMDQNMRVIGKTIKQTDMVNSFMQMEISMKGNGKTIKLMELGVISMRMEQLIKESGRMTNSMERESKHGLIMLVMKDNILKEKSTDLVNCNLQMAQFTQENFS